ncbi:Lrp/AsnC family transcriptional regulator [Phyllobacterium endophyticum]|uniref:Lrp/AsnC family transcriptional regulator n=1 Tax=Phyllobacterium endophyticum TaxID=1149773 RepID=A0A2P7B2L9_9HYPH|nr:Lrp/AsnC family transcriptional regulator [Phyllobacterium endophyticum]TYR42056.1 Lrp/AsnC family transcriptional regulator [Phyllobacterium endophyticum]
MRGFDLIPCINHSREWIYEPTGDFRVISSQLDAFEIKMLQILQSNGRVPITDLAQLIGLSPTPCARRFEQLQESGIIRGFAANIDRRSIGLMVEVFIQVRLNTHSDESPERFIAEIQRMDEVSSCWTMTGEHDFLLHVMVPTVDDLNGFVMHRLMRLKGVRDVHTQLVLQNIKGPGKIPLDHLKK